MSRGYSRSLHFFYAVDVSGWLKDPNQCPFKNFGLFRGVTDRNPNLINILKVMAWRANCPVKAGLGMTYVENHSVSAMSINKRRLSLADRETDGFLHNKK